MDHEIIIKWRRLISKHVSQGCMMTKIVMAVIEVYQEDQTRTSTPTWEAQEMLKDGKWAFHTVQC